MKNRALVGRVLFTCAPASIWMYFTYMKPEFLSDPHNAFVKGMLERRETARDFFAQYLPKGTAEQLDSSSLEILKETFVDKQ